jgi:hypothetical protein
VVATQGVISQEQTRVVAAGPVTCLHRSAEEQSMKRRTKIIASVAAASIGATLLWAGHLRSTNRRIDLAYDRIQPGMTFAEVEDLIGFTPGWRSTKYTPRECFSPHYRNPVDDDVAWHKACFSREGLADKYGILHKGWGFNRGAIVVALDADGRIVSKRFGQHWNYHWERFLRRNEDGLVNWFRSTLEDVFGTDLFETP